MAELSEEEHEIDIESDDDEERLSQGGLAFPTEAEKKAHHNALERKRRDQIKESFIRLRDAIPQARDEKISRAQILQRATKYIQHMSGKNQTGQKEIELLKRKVLLLRRQVEVGERLERRTPGCTDDLDPSEFSDTSEDYTESSNIGSNNAYNNSGRRSSNRSENSHGMNGFHGGCLDDGNSMIDFNQFQDVNEETKSKRAKFKQRV